MKTGKQRSLFIPARIISENHIQEQQSAIMSQDTTVYFWWMEDNCPPEECFLRKWHSFLKSWDVSLLIIWMEDIVHIFKKHDIKYVLLNGGNGTMDACGHIYEACKDLDIKVVGIPKTIDNDIAMTDHSPGYRSAARFIAASIQEMGEES